MARSVTIAALTLGYHVHSQFRDYHHPSSIRLGPALEDNLRVYEQAISEAGTSRGADFICFPELALSEGLAAEEERRAIVSLDGPEVARLALAAKDAGAYVIMGLKEKGHPKPYNSAVLLSPEGEVVGVYHKVHLTPGRYATQTPGDGWPVFETSHAKVGIQICYDYYFPEAARCLALGGAEIIFCPTYHDARGVEQALALQRARAIDNAVYYVSAVHFSGGHEPHTSARSLIIDPVGTIRADSGFRDGWAVATVDLDDPYPQIHSGMAQPQNTRRMILKSRRPETYGAVVAPRQPVPWSDVLLSGEQPDRPDDAANRP